jgi:polysaccharide export outer membrane protein
MRHEHSRYRPVFLPLISLLLAAVSGCAPRYEDLKVFVQEHDHDVTATRYRVDPPDIVVIASPNVAEIDGVQQRINIDGKITLPLLGDVKVSGLTPEEIAVKLVEMLRRYYVEPRVQVRVSKFASKRVYVFGQVSAPGPYTYTGKDSVLDVLAEATPTYLAWNAQIKVIRPSAKEDERHEIVVDVDRMVKSGDMRGNFLLNEGDIIYVPPTPLAWVGLRFRELLYPVDPALSTYRSPLEAARTSDEYEERR